MANVKDISRKNKVAQDYIEKISQEDYFYNIKNIDKSLSLFKRDIEKTGIIHRVKQDLQDFLVTENTFEGLGDTLFKQNFSAIALLSLDGKEKIKIAKNIINNSQKTEQKIREELGLISKANKENTEETKKQNNLELATNIETLGSNEKFIYNQSIKYGVRDKKQIAYILATVKGESGFKNIKEIGGEHKQYGAIDKITGQRYYGRGFVQLTHKGNYQKFNKIIQNSGIIFKDNNGNLINNIDIVHNPDSILSSNELAAFILIYGMKNGLFRGEGDKKHSLDYFINAEKTDFYNARNIVNGMSSNPLKYQSYAKHYLAELETQYDIDNSILIGPELLATNRDEFGGLGNSIMTGFQGYYQKTAFQHMNGVEGKNTTNHPDRFKTKEDVEKYKTKNPSIKSFVLYFGANTKNNKQTLTDLKKRSLWLKDFDIQPILSTCIGADHNTHLAKLNPQIRQLASKLNIPVLDFESSYNQKLIAMGSNQHPTGLGYKTMEQEILALVA